MISQNKVKVTPLYKALVDLADRMNKENMPPVAFNVIGDFVLMLHDDYPLDSSYAGTDFSGNLNRLIDEVSDFHHMKTGWINKDGMATGISIKDFEAFTGKFHFSHVLTVGDTVINILDEKDLLRLKVIAVDASMLDLEATGEFSRTKDFQDIHDLMDKMKMSPEDMIREYSDYMICRPDTGDLIHAIANGGPDGGLLVINRKKQEFEALLRGEHITDPFEDFLIDDLDLLFDNMNERGM